MTDPPLRVGVWCAVSSKPQADPEKESLPAQRRAGLEFARAVGGEVVRVYEVPGHSRDYWSWYLAEQDIPAYAEVRADLEAGRLDVIHCVDSDRLGRDPALVQQFYSLAEKCGCEVFDASMPHTIGQQAIGHRYGVAVKGVAAGEDQRRRVLRHKSGMTGRIRRGLPPRGWPVGYTEVRDNSGKVVGAAFDDRIGAVRLITRLFLEGQSYDQIAQVLRDTGWDLPGGKRWYHSMIWRTMQNDTYAGLVSWGKVRNPEPSDRFPALWDRDTYAAILRERKNRRADWIHPAGGPLSGVAFCARCGWGMGRVRARQPGEYYLRCSKHASQRRNGPCHPNHIRESEVLAAVSEWLSQFVTEEVLVAAMRKDAGLTDLEDEQDRVLARISDLEGRRRRIALALAAGDLDGAMYRTVDGELLVELGDLQTRKSELHTLIASRPDPAARRDHIKRLLTDPYALASWPASAVSGALRAAGIRVYCEDRAIELIGFHLAWYIDPSHSS